MRMSKLMGRTLREVPKDAELPSHRYLIRAGFARQYTAGLYGLLPLAHRVVRKIETIVRQEMDAIEGQEIRMPCMATKELWDESGRHSAIGKDMFRLKDRADRSMVLNMTHEEPVVYLARTELTSYKQLPAMAYQIQTKFRDEPRPRGGLIRLREFLMKDGYSFHDSEESLKAYYDRAHEAYSRAFKRIGLRNFISVLSDNGMFGGSYSHEFQLLVPTGEDKLITCGACQYGANLEIATTPYRPHSAESKALEKVATPNMKTIADLAKGLNIPAEQTAKCVMFQTADQKGVIAFVRGDLEVVEAKLKGALRAEVFPIKEDVLRNSGAVPGSTGPIGLKLANCTVVIDPSVKEAKGLATGANEADMHWVGFEVDRDFLAKLSAEEKKKVIVADIAAARPGDPCPKCGGDLQESRGIEIGNIFHLGTKYSGSMKCTYLDREGKAQNHIMGCYGIGITRLLPSVIEESHDARGMIFPMPVAPFELHLCVLNRNEPAIQEASEKLYADLKAAGIEVLLDDRDEKPGSQFADADLMGIPLRITLSPRTMAETSVEFKFRDAREPQKNIKLEGLVGELKSMIAAEYKRWELA
jgi:prolyl-tRNA synthetase